PFVALFPLLGSPAAVGRSHQSWPARPVVSPSICQKSVNRRVTAHPGLTSPSGGATVEQAPTRGSYGPTRVARPTGNDRLHCRIVARRTEPTVHVARRR